jgi:hypothetical protein
MGYSYWSDDAFQTRQDSRRSTGQTAFTYDAYVRATGQARVHSQMDPFGATRESRDSAEHPDSLAIGVMFDVTGSMGSVPRVLQAKLGNLMRVLVEKGYVAHPQVLFGAIGDAHCDMVPLQVGQFESGLEMDDDLGKIYLEGGGGGQVYESYELAMYFFALHTSIDCFERRGRKGYLFTIGDEKPYAAVQSEHVLHHIGDRMPSNLPTKRLVRELQKRYHTFHIIPTNTAHGRSADVQGCWRALLGERVLLLEDEAAVCETIALAIGLSEGTAIDLASGVDDLVRAGHDRGAAVAAAKALRGYGPPRLASSVFMPRT